MTPQLEKVIATIQNLSSQEQRQLLKILSEQVVEDNHHSSEQEALDRPSKVNAFQNWFAKIQPEMSDLNPDDAKWNYLQEKYNM